MSLLLNSHPPIEQLVDLALNLPVWDLLNNINANASNLELVLRESTNNSISAVNGAVNGAVSGTLNGNLPTNPNLKRIYLYYLKITVYEVIYHMPNDNITQLQDYSTYRLSESANFTYERFMEASKRMVERAVNRMAERNSDVVYTMPTRGSYLIYTTYLTGLDYPLFFVMTYFKTHLPYFIAPSIFIIRSLSNNRFALYLFLLVIQSKPVLAFNTILANKYITGFGWLAYINLMATYDILYKNIQSSHVSQTLFQNGRINFKFLGQRLLLGILFALVISVGVLFSSALGYLTIPSLTLKEKIFACIGCLIISTIGSTAWIMATKRELLGYGIRVWKYSYIRAFSESFAFNGLSYANFIIWSWIKQTFSIYLATFLVGLVLYFVFAFFQIKLEIALQNKLIYGLLYNLVFTSLSTSSSALYYLTHLIKASIPVKTVFILLFYTLIIMFPLEVYRFPPYVRLGHINVNKTLVEFLVGRERAKNPRVILLVGIIYQLTLFFSFALGTFIWLDWIGLSGSTPTPDVVT